MNRLRTLRIDAHLSIDELSQRTGVPARTIRRLENGTPNPRPKTLGVLADFFGVRASTLMPDADTNGKAAA